MQMYLNKITSELASHNGGPGKALALLIYFLQSKMTDARKADRKRARKKTDRKNEDTGELYSSNDLLENSPKFIATPSPESPPLFIPQSPEPSNISSPQITPPPDM